MADLSVLFSELDEEDLKYLQQSFQNILSGHEVHGLHSIESQFNNHLRMFANNEYNLLRNCDWINSDDNRHIVPTQLSVEHHFDQTQLLKDIFNEGVDSEDIRFLKISFKYLQFEPNESEWLSKLSWNDHPPSTGDSGNHPLGECARTREFGKIPKPVRARLRTAEHLKQSESTANYFIATRYVKSYKRIKNTSSRNARSDQRRLYTAYESITDSCLLKLNELKFRKKKLRLGKSEIHGLGLFAAEHIPVNDIIIEYVGEIIRPIIADIREEKYRLSSIGSYCFKIDDDTIIDATKLGNLNRFINHSCAPNSFAKILNINNKKKIVIYSKQAIRMDEEITYDYKMPFEQEKILCLCKAPNCRQTLN